MMSSTQCFIRDACHAGAGCIHYAYSLYIGAYFRFPPWVGEGDTPDTLIQDSSLEALLTPDYWLEVLTERGLNKPGTVLISGTVAIGR